jgi:AcrR family transcriptional regulator
MILDAARALFADNGYDGASIRDIAARAAIDPAMVIRYFGSKDELFARAAVIDLQLPRLDKIAPADVGTALIRHFLALWEGAEANPGLRVLLKSAAMNDFATRKVQEIFMSQVLPVLAHADGDRRAAEQAALIASQLLGLALCRYILKLPPMVEMAPEQLIAAVGPTLQRYFEGAEQPSDSKRRATPGGSRRVVTRRRAARYHC